MCWEISHGKEGARAMSIGCGCCSEEVENIALFRRIDEIIEDLEENLRLAKEIKEIGEPPLCSTPLSS